MKSVRIALPILLALSLAPASARPPTAAGAHKDYRGNLGKSRAAQTRAARAFDATHAPPAGLQPFNGPLSYAHPNPAPVSLRQPDGTTFGAKVRAKNLGGGLETFDGYTVVKNSTGWWTYALAGAGKVVASNIVVGRGAPAGIPRGVGRTQNIWVGKDGADVRAELFAYLRARSAALQQGANAAGEARIWKVPVLMIETYAPFQAENTPASFEQLLSGYGHNPTGTMTESYNEMSHGKFQVDIDVFGPYKSVLSTADHCFYGNTHAVGGLVGARGMAVEAVPQADLDLTAGPTGLDFSQYDNDNDGFVDFLVLLHSGPDAAATGDGCQTWSHMAPAVASGSTKAPIAVTNDINPAHLPVLIGNTMTIPEINLDIGVAAHEMMHALGEPDYYDTNYASQGTGDWDLGAGGSWYGDPPGSNPLHFNPMVKINQRWMSPRVVTGAEKGVALRPREKYSDLIVLPLKTEDDLSMCQKGAFGYTNITGGFIHNGKCLTEGMLIETVSRSVPGALFDRYALNTGLLVWHYDLTRWKQGGNNDPGPYMMDLEEFDRRDGHQDLSSNDTRGDPMDPWFDDIVGLSSATGESKDDSSNTISNDGERSGWAIGNIRPSGAEGSLTAAEFANAVTFDIFKHSEKTADLSPDYVRVLRGEVVQKGRRVSLATKIYNHGGKPIGEGTSVRFADGSKVIGTSTLGTIADYGHANAAVNWTPSTEGLSRITVTVTPPGGVAQTTTLNDSVMTEVNVWPSTAKVLIVDDDDGFPGEETSIGALRALGVPFAVAETHATSATMKRFRAVIWNTANSRFQGQMDGDDRNAVEQYLAGGGRLWLSGPNAARAFDAATASSGGVAHDFLHNWFGAEYVDTAQRSAGEIRGEDAVLGAGARYVLDIPYARPMGDILQLGASANGEPTAVFVKPDAGDAVVGTRVQGDAAHKSFRTFFSAFDLMQITDGRDRVALVDRVIKWFGVARGSWKPSGATIAHATRWSTRAWNGQPIIATVTGTSGPVLLHFRRHATSAWTTIDMTSTGMSQYEARIPAWEVTPAGVDYWIEASGARSPAGAMPYFMAAGPSAKTAEALAPRPLPKPGGVIKPRPAQDLPATGVPMLPPFVGFASLAVAAAGTALLRRRRP
jgi:M6 family metalloprotease-like protein